MPGPNDPQLVAKALAKAQSVEQRLNALISSQGAPAVSYGAATTVITQSAPGIYTWTCPAGVTSAMVECWGAGGGGTAGNASLGASGGGGGAYSQEPSYPVVPGNIYTYVVGDGGIGSVVTVTGFGLPGGNSFFDLNGAPGGVLANGGSYLPGGAPGGAATPGQTISFAGGNGASTPAGGGAGGGGSGGSTGAGGNGHSGSGSTGGAGGTAGTGGGAAGGAGGNSAANGVNGSFPGGGGGGVGAGTASGVVSKSYSPTSSASYYGSDAFGGNASNKDASLSPGMQQNGSQAGLGFFNGTMKSVMIFPSASIVTDLSGVTIDIITLQLSNNYAEYSRAAVQAGYTAHTALPNTFDGVTGVTAVLGYSVASGSFQVQNVETLATPLKAGTAKALVLGPGPAYNPNYHSSYAGAGQAGAPVIAVLGHTGTANKVSGEGGDGQVQITYQVPGALIAAMQSAQVSDVAGNTMAAGFTGQSTAIQPASSPAVPETWHNLTSFVNGWTATAGTSCRYKLLSQQGAVWIQGTFTPGTLTDATQVCSVSDSNYWPAATANLWAGTRGGSAAINDAIVQVLATGAVQVLSMPTGTTSVRVNGIYALD